MRMRNVFKDIILVAAVILIGVAVITTGAWGDKKLRKDGDIKEDVSDVYYNENESYDVKNDESQNIDNKEQYQFPKESESFIGIFGEYYDEQGGTASEERDDTATEKDSYTMQAPVEFYR